MTLNTRKMTSFRKVGNSAIMQRPLQNGQFGGANTIAKNMRKTIIQPR